MQVDFYVLNTPSRLRAWHYLCELIEQQHHQFQKRIFIYADSADDAAQFDSLLWIFKDTSFIPHSIDSSSEDKDVPVLIGQTLPDRTAFDILINLSAVVPDFVANFNHVIEIVFTEPNMQQLARVRFRNYREQGATLSTIKI